MFSSPVNRLLKQSLLLYGLFSKSLIVKANQQKLQLDSLRYITPKSIVVLDFETTGAASDCSIREIGAVKVEHGEITDCYHALVKPKEGDNLSEYAKLMKRTREAFPDLINFCSGSYIVAHNAAFERRFLRQIYSNEPDIAIFDPAGVFCTYRLAIKIFPDQENYKLSPLARRLALSFPNALKSHRALDDVFMTKLLWDRCVDYIQERGVVSEFHLSCLFNIQLWHKDFTNQIIEHYAEISNNKKNKLR